MPDDAALVIGAYCDKDELHTLSGSIERVSVWSRALSEVEVAREFASRKALFPEIEALRPEVVDWPTYQRDSQRTGIAGTELAVPLQRNSACSGDTLVHGELQLQWFGEPGPREMIDRHHRAAAPLFCHGRLFIPGADRIIAADAYNGVPLWEREVPGSRRIAIFRDCSPIVAGRDQVYVAAEDQCRVLAAETGEVLRTLTLPDGEGQARDWGYLALLNARIPRKCCTTLPCSTRPQASRSGARLSGRGRRSGAATANRIIAR